MLGILDCVLMFAYIGCVLCVLYVCGSVSVCLSMLVCVDYMCGEYVLNVLIYVCVYMCVFLCVFLCE